MEEQISITNEEVIDYISKELDKYDSKINKEDIQLVLDLEYDYLKLRGVIIEGTTKPI